MTAATTESSGQKDRIRTPTLLYDANCGTCKMLAYKFRESAKRDVEIVALESPEGERILDRFYPEGWDHDFYLVEDDDTIHKGVKALPRVAKLAGVKSSGVLVKDYLALKSMDHECDSCGDDHGDATAASRASAASNTSSISRRAFAGAVSTAVGLAPLSGLGAASEQQLPDPPSNLQVHVASVTADGDGGYDATVERRQDLANSEHPLKEEARKRSKKRASATESDDRNVSADTTALAASSANSGATIRVNKIEKEHRLKDPDPNLVTAMRQQGGDERVAETESYHGVVDHQRFAASLSVGRGPAVTDDGPEVLTSMSGTVEHDTAYPAVDFVVVEGDVSAEAHIEAYAAGVSALSDFYAKRDNEKMGSLYADIERGLLDVREEFAASVDETLEPSTNHLAISGLPGFEGFAEPPKTSQSSVASGYDCGFSCGCPNGDTCCGCGIGCGICVAPCSFCYCCVVASCGCGYECCLS